MFIAKDKKGNQIEVCIYGTHSDDIQIDSAVYSDGRDEDVPDDVIDYIMDNYQEEMYTDWLDQAMGYADDLHDRWKDDYYEND